MPTVARKRMRVYPGILLAVGLVLAGAGGWLAALGGSWYYLLAGAAVIAAGVLLWRGERWGSWLYGLMLLATLVWTLFESGLYLWAWVPRLLAPMVLGLWLLTPWVQHRLNGRGLLHRLPGRSGQAVGIAAILAIVGVGLGVGPRLLAQNGNGAATPQAAGDWAQYGNTAAGTRYSPIGQITPDNVGRLKLAWSFRTGDLPGPNEISRRDVAVEATPLAIGGRVFVCTPHSWVVAIDAETGKQLWRFDPHADYRQATHLACRGVSYLAVPGATGACAQRLYYGAMDAKLWSIDAVTGRPCSGFGQRGAVNLLEDLGRVRPGFHFSTSPPAIIGGKVVLGGWVSDNQATDEPSGVIRAFDGITGQLAWAWDMGVPDRIGAPPPGKHYTRDTPNAWAPLAADPALGLVYVPTGNAPPDFWGGKRRPFDDRYSSSIVALDASTGRPRWSFQTTHHDIWDYDVPSQPVLVDIPSAAGVRQAVVQSTKRGEIFVLDRRTGRPIFPVTERRVPQGSAPGDYLSPTQPFSAISLLPEPLTGRQMWGATPLDQLWCRIQFQRARYDGIFTPIQVGRRTIYFPGSLGVVDWGGLSVNVPRSLIVANSSAVAYINHLVPREQAPERAQSIQRVPSPGKTVAAPNTGAGPQVGTPYVASITPFLSPLGIPCNEPPWGFLQAISLKTGKLAWKRPIGTPRHEGPFGIPSMLDIRMGVPEIGGTITTGSGLIFVAATVDDYLRAFDVRNGRELWRASLPAGGQATPATYVSPKSGRQFVVLAAGGSSIMGTPVGDHVVAYALP